MKIPQLPAFARKMRISVESTKCQRYLWAALAQFLFIGVVGSGDSVGKFSVPGCPTNLDNYCSC